VFYLHPWEIDPGQPRLQVGRLGRFRHYRNLAETEGRLKRLLGEFRFGRVDAVVAGVEAEATPGPAQSPLPYAW
jgi:hypothetical protein